MGLLSKILSKMVKGIKQTSKVAMIGIVLLGVILAVAACNSQDAQKPVKATWIKPQVAGDTVSIPVSEVNNKIVHFSVPVAAGSEMAFMAYELDGNLNVRANVCPPCRSVGFSLSKDTLVCDTCRTTFKAKTGDGISGACVGYPKAAVPYQISDGKLVMKGNDLVTAYQNTNEPGLP
ncbi:Fe-S-containing protein [Chloroflexota bacterium]